MKWFLTIGLILSLMNFFAKERFIKQELPFFLLTQIEKDLEGITIDQEALHESWVNIKQRQVVKYKYINGRLYSNTTESIRKHVRYIVITQALEVALSGIQKDLEFIVCLEDYLNENNNPAPLFVFATQDDSKNVILMPDCEALNKVDRNYLTSVITKKSKIVSWDDKAETLFWRGSPTGKLSPSAVQNNDWQGAPRFCLVELSNLFPSCINAAFTGKWQNETPLVEILSEKFSFSPTIHPKDHLLYKYLLDVDGNSCCYSRTFWILLSNSLMLKQLSNNRQWFYRGLVPYVHFVPVKENLSDLYDQIKWCHSHEGQIQKMVKESTEFALDYLQYETNVNYLAELLSQYSQKMKFTPTLDAEDKLATPTLFSRKLYAIKALLKKMIKSQPVALRYCWRFT